MHIASVTLSPQSLSARARRALGTPRDWFHYRRKRFWALVILVLYTLGGFFLVPWVAERQIPEVARDLLQRPVTVEGVSFNPFVLSTEVRGFRLEENNGDNLAEVDSLYINFQLSSLFRWAWTFAEIRLERPSLDLVRFEDGGINLLRLLPEREQPQEEAPGGPPRLIIAQFTVNEGMLQFRDKARASDFTVPVSPINLNFTNISTLPEDGGEHRLVARSRDGANLRWQGTSQFSPLQLRGEIAADGPYPALIYHYFRDLLDVRVTDGQAQMNLAYHVQQGDNGELSARIDPLQLTLKDLTLAEEDGDTVFTLPEASLNDLRLHWPEQTLTVASLTLMGADLQLLRNADGQLNVQHWLAESNDASPPTRGTDESTGGEPFGGWTLALNNTRIHDLNLAFEDAALRDPGTVQITGLNLDMGRITSTPGERFPLKLALSLASGGHIQLDGEAAVLPSPTVDGEYTVSELALAGAQPWLSDQLRATIDDGLLDVAGIVATSPEDPFNISGELSLRQLDISATVTEEKLLGWQSLEVDRFTYNLADNRLELSLLTLADPFARVLIDEDQNTNIGRLLVDDAAAPGESTRSSPGKTSAIEPFSLSLGRARVEQGTVDFADLSLPIPFKTWIADLSGGLDSFDSNSSEPATLDLQGQVDEYGLATIKGSLNLLLPTEQTDIEVVFRNIDIPDLSSYTIKFAGRQIANGRMDLDLGYQLNNGKLQGRNDIVIHDLELGERVDFEGAANLPLGLAVALLKGPDGRIRVDLPVEGDVNSPSFRFGKVIANAILNLITRVATSPFRLLGSLVGAGGDDFDQLHFAPGITELSPPEREKVAKLVEALKQRPALGLRVAAVMDPRQDREALKQRATDASIEAATAGMENTKQPFTARRRQAMENLFLERFSAAALAQVRDANQKPEDPEKPEGRQVLDTTAYLAELRRKLIEVQQVSGEQLQALARKRAETLTSLLTADNGMNPERVQITAVKAVTANQENQIPLKLEVEDLE